MYSTAPSLDISISRELALLAPPNERVSWLYASWRPDWERWCIWQMSPPGTAPTVMWGPDTRLVVRAETVLGNRMIRLAPDPRFRQVLNRANMTRWAWELHLATGAYPQPFWVVEGEAGGHKWQFSEEEARLLKLHGHSGETPEPGSMSYAPIDRRVIEKLLPLDQLRMWNTLSKGLHELDSRDLDARENQIMLEANRALWNWIQTQVDEAVSETVTGRDKPYYHDADANYEEIEREFIESDLINN